MATLTNPTRTGTDADPAELVLLAAERLFTTRGIHSVSVDQIRAEAGVPLKRMYQSYPSKADLITEVLRLRDERWRSGWQRHLDRATTPRERLLAVFDWLGEITADDAFHGCSFINSFGELGGVSASVAQAAREHKLGIRAQLTTLVGQAGLPDVLVGQLALLVDGALASAAIAGPNAAAEAKQAAEVLVDAIS